MAGPVNTGSAMTNTSINVRASAINSILDDTAMEIVVTNTSPKSDKHDTHNQNTNKSKLNLDLN